MKNTQHGFRSSKEMLIQFDPIDYVHLFTKYPEQLEKISQKDKKSQMGTITRVELEQKPLIATSGPLGQGHVILLKGGE